MKPEFASKYTGMRICLDGALQSLGKGGKFVRGELSRHIALMGAEYYKGNVAMVDTFLQLYCIAEKEREDALKLTYPKTIEEESFESLSLANAGLEIANTHLQDENNELKAKLATIEPMLFDLRRMLNGGKP